MQNRDLGWKVGVFVLTGFLVAAALILQFGKFGDRFRGDYQLVVRFQNASGLIIGSQVLYAGVEVGKVQAIRLEPEGRYVDVVLSMFRFRSFKYIIKEDATFTIKRSGLLGDVSITIHPGSENAPEAQPGQVLHGKAPTNLSEMAESAEELLLKLNEAVDRLSMDLFDEQTLADLRQSVKNVRELTGNMSDTTRRLNKILAEIEEGKGTIGKLFQNEEIFENFRALSYNLRKGGVLFYRDRYDKDKKVTPEEEAAEKREKQYRSPKSKVWN
jgi:phospholipid/cholesterol/gamma-HCH transport system substrate-binding protein